MTSASTLHQPASQPVSITLTTTRRWAEHNTTFDCSSTKRWLRRCCQQNSGKNLCCLLKIDIRSVLLFSRVLQSQGIRPVKKLSSEVLAWLSVWSKVQTCIWSSWCHCYSLSLAPVKSRLVLPFWYWLTWVVPDIGPLNGCVSVALSTTFC